MPARMAFAIAATITDIPEIARDRQRLLNYLDSAFENYVNEKQLGDIADWIISAEASDQFWRRFDKATDWSYDKT